MKRHVLPLLTTALLAVAIAGCTNKSAKLDSDPITTGSTSTAAPAGGVGSYIKTRELEQAWQQKPGDETIGLAYADALNKLGQQNAALDVLKTVSVAHGNDALVQAKIGKQFLAAGRPGEAVTVLERAAVANSTDWKIFSALGTAYDQQGQYEQARSQYNKALALQPGSIAVQNNLGMSFALQGKLPEAEKVLNMALAEPGSAAIPRVRQNLALVVGLQGRFDEARKIAAADLPPAQVEMNLAYLQQMLAKPNTWAELSKDNAAN
ncbi:MAG TPA: tetratricopeptide repeat protein [Aestuariivirga sp.]